MIIAYIPFIYFCGLFLYKWNKNRVFNVGSIIVFFYIISSLFSIVYLHVSNETDFVEAGFDNLAPTIIYCFLLTIVILPIYNFRSETIKAVTLPPSKERIFKIISWLLIALSLISVISSFSSIRQTLTGNLLDVRNSFYRENLDFSASSGSQPLYQYFLNLGVSLSPISLLFFFYGFIYHKEHKLLNILLLIASTSQVLQSILNASRTQAVYWIMTVVTLYVCFRPQMDSKQRRVFRLLALIFGGLTIIYFGMVTVSRFQVGGASNAIQNSIIMYIGLPYPEFCKLFRLYTFDGVCFDRTFPIICKYIFGSDFNLYQYRINITHRIGMYVGTFFTFLGDAMIDFGKIGMFLYTFLFSLLERFAFKRQSDFVSLPKMILFLLILRVPLLGIFAYVYLNVTTSLAIIGAVLIMIALNSKFKIVFGKREKQRLNTE